MTEDTKVSLTRIGICDIDSMTLADLRASCMAVVLDTGSWTEDDGVRLKEVLGLRYRIQGDSALLQEAQSLAAVALPPYRQGFVDSARGGTDYWRLIGGRDEDGPFAQIIRQLRKKPTTKQASIAVPLGPTGMPCLVNLDFKVRDGVLWLGTTFRSQDVYRRQPDNIAFLCEVANQTGAILGVSLFRLDVMVASAHIYEPDIEVAAAQVESYTRARRPLNMARRPLAVAVIGKERLSYDNADHIGALADAYRASMYLAANDCVIVTGGLGGIMEASSSGTQAVGGVAVGIVPEIIDDEGGLRKPNETQRLSVATSLDQRARMPLIIDSVDVVLVVHGGGGARIEAEMALSRGLPVVTLAGSGGVADELARERRDGLFAQTGAAEAAALCIKLGRDWRVHHPTGERA